MANAMVAAQVAIGLPPGLASINCSSGNDKGGG